jgi:hypothetical protein
MDIYPSGHPDFLIVLFSAVINSSTWSFEILGTQIYVSTDLHKYPGLIMVIFYAISKSNRLCICLFTDYLATIAWNGSGLYEYVIKGMWKEAVLF